MKDNYLGKQEQGQSPDSIKIMAENALNSLLNNYTITTAADIGGGEGKFSNGYLSARAKEVFLLDYYDQQKLAANVTLIKTDLNTNWMLEDNTIDLAVSLEVIEHLENPRNFIRSMKRILAPGGYGFISTPNNTNFFSRLNFAFTGCHRYFKNTSYPAHITALTKIEIARILKEEELEIIDFYYNYEDALPLFSAFFHIKSPLFSSSIGVLFKKQKLS